MKLLSAALLFVALSAQAVEVQREPYRFTFDYRLTIPSLTQPGQMWLPLATTDGFQTVQTKLEAPIPHREVVDAANANHILVFSPGPEDSGKTIVIHYVVERREKLAYPEFRDTTRYLQPDLLVPNNPKFRAIAEEAVGSRRDALSKGRALYDHVLARMKYDKSGVGWGRGDALYACDAKAGNCTDFHSYFIALARSIGIPARFAIGFTVPAEDANTPVKGYHCWAEFCADGKWVPVDISEASQHPELTEYYFGNMPANRFELSRGRDLVVDPLPATGPINFLVYPLLEVEGKPVKVETEFVFHRLPPL